MSGHPSAAGRAQDRESTPAKDRRSTTEPTPPTGKYLSCHWLHNTSAPHTVTTAHHNDIPSEHNQRKNHFTPGA